MDWEEMSEVRMWRCGWVSEVVPERERMEGGNVYDNGGVPLLGSAMLVVCLGGKGCLAGLEERRSIFIHPVDQIYTAYLLCYFLQTRFWDRLCCCYR